MLDIGTGSGILAIEAARSAAAVTGIDINDRATRFASFNASLNGVSNSDFQTCDLMSHTAVDRYELGPIGTNCYVVRATRGAPEAVVIDQTNYDERSGYDPEFLGKGKLAIPLPAVRA